MVAGDTIVIPTTGKFMKPSHMLWPCFMKTRTYNRACSMLRRIPLLQPSWHPSHSVRISHWLAMPASTPMLTISNQHKNVTTISTPTSVMKKTTGLLHQGARKWSKSSERFTIPPRDPPQRSEVQFVRRTVKSKIQWTLTNG